MSIAANGERSDAWVVRNVMHEDTSYIGAPRGIKGYTEGYQWVSKGTEGYKGVRIRVYIRGVFYACFSRKICCTWCRARWRVGGAGMTLGARCGCRSFWAERAEARRPGTFRVSRRKAVSCRVSGYCP